jgi:hypothetical protein
VFHFSNQFLGHKLLDREHPVSWSIVMEENPIVELNFLHFSMHVTVCLNLVAQT